MDYKELISQLQKPIMVDGAYVVDHLRREAAETIASLIERAAIAEYELAQKNEYYDQMVDALAALSSKELEETKQKLKSAEARVEQAENIASDLCDDFTDFVTGGVHNAAPYCANCRPECVNARGWCEGDNRVCKGFLPKAAGAREEE